MAIFIKNESNNIYGIEENKVRKVEVPAMTEEQLEICQDIEIEMNECFSNAYRVVMSNPERFSYVLGAANFIFHYEHAFIKDNKTNTYFDPTSHIARGEEETQEMLIIKEYNFDELCDFVLKQGEEAYPPSFKVISEMKSDMDMFVTLKQQFASKKENDNSFTF